MKIKKPSYLKKYFWDINWNNFDPKKYPDFVIERILENGNQKAYHWLKNNFTKKKIKEVLKNSQKLSKKSANFWAEIYNINKKDIKCLKKLSLKIPELAWKN